MSHRLFCDYPCRFPTQARRVLRALRVSYRAGWHLRSMIKPGQPNVRILLKGHSNPMRMMYHGRDPRIDVERSVTAMLNKTVQDAINEQIKHEFFSAHLYLSMAAYCDAINLPGAAHWMRLQSQEERAHAMKFFDFV